LRWHMSSARDLSPLSLKRESMLSASGRQSYHNNVRYISNKVME